MFIHPRYSDPTIASAPSRPPQRSGTAARVHPAAGNTLELRELAKFFAPLILSYMLIGTAIVLFFRVMA